MVNVYEELLDNDGNTIPSRTKLFVPAKEVKEDGSFISFQSGILVTPDTSGYFYIVDSWVLHQIEKLKIVGGMLSVKDGEQLQERIKSPEELRIEELEKEMQMLKAKQNVQPAHIEEQSDEPTA